MEGFYLQKGKGGNHSEVWDLHYSKEFTIESEIKIVLLLLDRY